MLLSSSSQQMVNWVSMTKAGFTVMEDEISPDNSVLAELDGYQADGKVPQKVITKNKELILFFFLTLFFFIICYLFIGDIMKVKIFDEEDEKDLENDINEFLEDLDGEVVDIKYQVSVGVFSEEQVFCFSAMIVYY